MHAEHTDTIMTTTQFLEKYTSLTLFERLCVRGCWRPNRTATYWLSHSYSHQHFFPVLRGCSTGGLEPSLSGCWFSLLHLISNWSGLQTNWLPVFTELYNSSTPPSSCGRHNCTHSTHPRSRYNSDIPRQDAPVIYIDAFPILTDRLGRRSIYNTWSPITFGIPFTITFHVSLFTPFYVFHTNVSWCFLTGIWVTVSLLKSPGLFSVFKPIVVPLYCHLI